MKLKLDDKGAVVVEDGKPVYVYEDGAERPFDAQATVTKIGQLNGEAKAHRIAKETAETALKAFEGIEDPAAALSALAKIKNIDDKKLLDAGKVEEIRAAAVEAVKAQYEDVIAKTYKPVVTERDKLKSDLYEEKIGGAFARSKFITDKIAVPSDLMQSQFAKHFAIEDGKTVAKDAAGNPIYSTARPGELADFEEALESLVNQYPQKEHILKGAGGGGGGSPTKGGGKVGAKEIKRSEFMALDPVTQGAKMVEGFKVVD